MSYCNSAHSEHVLTQVLLWLAMPPASSTTVMRVAGGRWGVTTPTPGSLHSEAPLHWRSDRQLFSKGRTLWQLLQSFSLMERNRNAALMDMTSVSLGRLEELPPPNLPVVETKKSSMLADFTIAAAVVWAVKSREKKSSGEMSVLFPTLPFCSEISQGSAWRRSTVISFSVPWAGVWVEIRLFSCHSWEWVDSAQS